MRCHVKTTTRAFSITGIGTSTSISTSTGSTVSMASKDIVARNKHQAPQRPPLTHFLCLPLLTPTSTAELRASIAHFRSFIETAETAADGDGDAVVPEAQGGRQTVARPRPRIPPAAFRPLGTLHLTLGVMSLKEPGRLQGAVELLERVDLEGMLRGVSEATKIVSEGSESTDTVAAEQSVQGRPATSTGGGGKGKNKQTLPPLERPVIATRSAQTTPPPPSSPQQVLRKVGGDRKSQVQSPGSAPTSPPQPQPPEPLQISLRGLHPFPATDPTKATVLHTRPHDPTLRLYPFCLSVLSAFQRAGYLVHDRELTLHATLFNTVYAKDPRSRGRRGEKRNGKGRLTVDATDVLRVFNQQDGRSSSIATNIITTPGMKSNDDDTTAAFTFASHITLDRVQICEMGAKKLDPTTDDPGGVLGERYVVVAEKMILPP